MEDLVRIKALEAELSLELEQARKDASLAVETARGKRQKTIEDAVAKARAEADQAVLESERKASEEAAGILSGSEGELKGLRAKYSLNSKKALDYVLGALGV